MPPANLARIFIRLLVSCDAIRIPIQRYDQLRHYKLFSYTQGITIIIQMLGEGVYGTKEITSPTK